MTGKARLDCGKVRDLLARAIREDLGSGDVTSRATIGPRQRLRGRFVAKQDMVVAGLPLLAPLYRIAGGGVAIRLLAKEGRRVRRGTIIARVEGRGRTILAAERTILNFLQRLGGVATITRAYVEAAGDRAVRIMDTRKTTPCWRYLEKYAVVLGGGTSHRKGLYDQILLKENHIAAVAARRGSTKGAVAEAVRRARVTSPRGAPLEVEVRTLDEFREALDADADIILLDNAPPALIRTALRLRGRHAARVEISGGVTFRTIRSIARLRPDRISVGALTHSAPAVDISFLVDARA
jgi:nicotinate-nucleotide pyrophosphorylase (carboxylating)